MKHRIIVVGANSYIARNCIAYLGNRCPQAELCLYDRNATQIDGYDNYRSLDVLSSDEVRAIDWNCDAVFMFVGKTGTLNGFDEYDTFIDVNERALLNILDACRRQGSRATVVFPSTRLVYKGSSEPLHEDAEKEFKTVYAVTKYACEQYLQQYHNVFGLNYSIFRICVPYGSVLPGAGSSFGTLGFMVGRAKQHQPITLYGGGEVRRTLTHVEDICRIMVTGVLENRCVNDVFNIGGDDYSLNEMASIIAERFNASVTAVPWPETALKIESGSTVFADGKLRERGLMPQRHFADWVQELS